MADLFLEEVVRSVEEQTGGPMLNLDPGQRPDGEDDGPGVPVPTGPRPLRGGARAEPPRAEER